MTGGPGEIGKGRAGHDDRFAERDDDEQRAALGHVAAFDRSSPPSTRRRISGSRTATAGEIYSIASATIHSASAQCPSRKPARDPEHGATPTARSVIRTAFSRSRHSGIGVMTASRKRCGRPASRHRPARTTIRGSSNAVGIEVESTSPPSINANSSRRTGVSLRIEPVGDPGGVDPHPPDRRGTAPSSAARPAG